MAFLQALHTLNLTPHPAPVAPLADPEWSIGVDWGGLHVGCLSALADRCSDAGACAHDPRLPVLALQIGE